jgi:LDH2 family malate/lactate/ureidoglycolate dehydrogenase
VAEPRIGWEALQAFMIEVFRRVGMPDADARIEAEVLVWANLRGVDSHGVLRIEWYLELIDNGIMNLRPAIRVEKETAAIAIIDGDHALGPVVTTMAMRKAIDKARHVGIGWVYIRNTTHQGAMGYYALMAAREGMAGIAIVNGPPTMAPFGAAAMGVHNTPVAICVPGRRRRPLLLDMAMSVAAGGKLRLAKDRGTALPPGWMLDKSGRPTTDPQLAAILLPIAGPKGSGLALMMECLTGVMLGDPLLEPALAKVPGADRHRQHGIVAAIDIATFTAADGYRDHVDAIVDELKKLPRSDGVADILVPGELEDLTYDERMRNGIPLPAGTIQKLEVVSRRVGVPLPELVSA